MINWLKKIIASDEARLKKLWKIVEKVNSLEDSIKKLSDEELASYTFKFKERLANGETLDDILPEAFAVVREASVRTIGMRHFDVQVLGAIVLHQGKIAEMKTGEGKTLVATMPAYLNALTGEGVHIVTVNDYLAKRDREWMGPVYEFLGLKVGVLQHDQGFKEKKEAYLADITYGTNNEFGFDYLRDNMAIQEEELVQRGHNYAIIDEVDSILIDEARTPLIISGPSEGSVDIYRKANAVARKLRKEKDFEVDEKTKNVTLKETGVEKAEELFGISNLYDPANSDLLHALIQALKAQHLFKRDIDYIVKDGEVIIVDEFTGRLMFGRRYSDGLHQAIEAKEGVKIKKENQTLATITLQNYFRMYKKIAGMTGTAKTEEEEFLQIYGMEVMVIPTNKPMIRVDHPDVVYRTKKEKFERVVEEIKEAHDTGRPVLVGTTSIENSEKISKMLKKLSIPHAVLNAKYHEKEAQIIAKAGEKGAVTIATNMAGRGTDIVLGEGVVELGGLYVIGTERHESRRIDNQLRGRSGRQGDPGASRFFLSLEDDLLRLFGGDMLSNIMNKLNIEEGTPIEHPLISRAIERAQKRVEARNFAIRKQLLEYDNVMEKQRNIIYSERMKVLKQKDIKHHILNMIDDLIDTMVDIYAYKDKYPEEWDWENLYKREEDLFGTKIELSKEKIMEQTIESLKEDLKEKYKELYNLKEKEIGEETFRELERFILLRTVDIKWKEHLLNMDHLKEGIGYRAYSQRDPFIEYSKEAFEMFQDMIYSIKEDTIRILYRVSIEPMEEPKREERKHSSKKKKKKKAKIKRT